MHFAIPAARSRLLAFVAASLCVGVLFAQSTWSTVPGFASRSRHATVFDEAGGRVLIFGGVDDRYFGDVWSWDGVQLSELSPVVRPPAGEWVAALDSTRNRVVALGRPAQQSSLSTWVFDGVDWSEAPVTQNPTTSGFSIAYDAARDRVVCWAAVGIGAGQVWEYDAVDWVAIPNPLVRPRHSLAYPSIVYDPSRGSCVVFQPSQESGLWAWDGSQWLREPGPSFSGNAGSRMVYDGNGQRLLLVGGGDLADPALHAWDGLLSQWVPLGVGGPQASDHGVWFDPVRNIVGSVGGRTIGSSVDSSIWEWDGASWQRRTFGAPGGRQETKLAHDASLRRTYMYGGESGESDLWRLEQSNWELLVRAQANQLPSPSWPGSPRGTRIVFDDARAGLVLLGGDPNTFNPVFPMYRLAGNEWEQIPLASAPPLRRDPSVCYDSRRQRVLLFGGRSVTGFGDWLNDLWAWDGVDWTELTTTVRPPERDSAGMAYDRMRDRVVLIGGSGFGPFVETWEFDGQAWALASSGGPRGLDSDSLTYDGVREAVLGYARQTSGSDLDQTWLWDGADWVELVTATKPDTGRRMGGAYDRDRRETVVFGGAGDSSEIIFGSLWRLQQVELAAWIASGIGCDAGNGLLELEALDPAAIDSTVRFRLRNALPSFVALPIGWVGFQELAAPVELAALGAPGCFAWATADVAIPMLSQGPEAFGLLALPDEPAALGLEPFVQAASWDFASSTLATANLLQARVGAP
ncbi:MAG: hypothetical protein AB8H80_02060 [Planctomycetota bacterium]